MTVQLQPQFSMLEQWQDLAQKEGFSFEMLDLLSAPGIGEPEKGPKIAKYHRTGLVHSIHGAFIDVNPASGDPLFRELSRQRCRESCEMAVLLGAKNVVFHSSCFPFLRGAYLESWANSCASFYEELISQYPVNIYIENAQDVDPEPIAVLMDRIDSDRIGVCLDIGHANYSQATVSQWYSALGERIGYLHLSDNLGAFDDHLPLGQGKIDWALVDALWRSAGKDTVITLETGSLETTQMSIDFLRQSHYFGL